MTIVFEVEIGRRQASAVETFYDEVGRSFWSAHEREPTHSVLINDVEIHTDNEGHALFIDGYCPRESWIESSASPPRATLGQVTVRYGRTLPRGASARLTSPAEWQNYYNPRDSWLCVAPGSAEQPGRALRLYSGLILVIHGHRLSAVWVHVRPQRAALN